MLPSSPTLQPIPMAPNALSGAQAKTARKSRFSFHLSGRQTARTDWELKNPGRTYRRKPLHVLESDYPGDADGVAIQDAVYDTIQNEGFVVVGTSHQTSKFAVACVRRWWRREWQSPADLEI